MRCGNCSCDHMAVGEGDEMSILTIMIIAIIVNFVVGLIVGLISKDERVAIVAVIVADFILIALYTLQ